MGLFDDLVGDPEKAAQFRAEVAARVGPDKGSSDMLMALWVQDLSKKIRALEERVRNLEDIAGDESYD